MLSMAGWCGTEVTRSAGFGISSLGDLTGVSCEAFVCTPDTPKVNIKGYQQKLQIRAALPCHVELVSLSPLLRLAVPEHIPKLS